MTCFLRQTVYLRHVHAKQCGGLVNERTRSAGAVAVHAHVGHASGLKENHLAVLAADVH